MTLRETTTIYHLQDCFTVRQEGFLPVAMTRRLFAASRVAARGLYLCPSTPEKIMYNNDLNRLPGARVAPRDNRGRRRRWGLLKKSACTVNRVALITALLVCLGCRGEAQQPTLTGAFPALAQQPVHLVGFAGFKTYPIASATVSADGHFALSYSENDFGMGYLVVMFSLFMPACQIDLSYNFLRFMIGQPVRLVRRGNRPPRPPDNPPRRDSGVYPGTGGGKVNRFSVDRSGQFS
jgi:hypothetical protein